MSDESGYISCATPVNSIIIIIIITSRNSNTRSNTDPTEPASCLSPVELTGIPERTDGNHFDERGAVNPSGFVWGVSWHAGVNCAGSGDGLLAGGLNGEAAPFR